MPPASVASQSPVGGLAVEAFADVLVDNLIVREAPGLSSAALPLCLADAPPPCGEVMIGQRAGYPLVYLLDGPAEADGYEWYLVATEGERSQYPQHVGWAAAGDADDAWLVRRDVPCPRAPLELGDVTLAAISPLVALHCLGGVELTLRGYYTDPPPGEPLDGDCVSEPGWLVCNIGARMLRVVEGPWEGDADNLWLHVHPDMGEMPPRPGWIEVTGQFDHPEADACAGATQQLHCRIAFVVTAARASD